MSKRRITNKKLRILSLETPSLRDLLNKAEERLDSGEKTKSWTREWRKIAGILWEKAVVSLTGENLFYITNAPILKWKTFRGFSSWLYKVTIDSITSEATNYLYNFSNQPYGSLEYDFSEIKKQVDVLRKIWEKLFNMEYSYLGENCLLVNFSLRHLDSVIPEAEE